MEFLLKAAWENRGNYGDRVKLSPTFYVLSFESSWNFLHVEWGYLSLSAEVFRLAALTKVVNTIREFCYCRNRDYNRNTFFGLWNFSCLSIFSLFQIKKKVENMQYHLWSFQFCNWIAVTVTISSHDQCQNIQISQKTCFHGHHRMKCQASLWKAVVLFLW